MSDLIAAIKERRAKITPPPWTTIDRPWGDGDVICTGHGDPHGQTLIAETGIYDQESEEQIEDRPLENAEFIAKAPTDIDTLLAAVARLTADRDAYLAVVEAARECVEADEIRRPLRWRELIAAIRALDQEPTP